MVRVQETSPTKSRSDRPEPEKSAGFVAGTIETIDTLNERLDRISEELYELHRSLVDHRGLESGSDTGPANESPVRSTYGLLITVDDGVNKASLKANEIRVQIQNLKSATLY